MNRAAFLASQAYAALLRLYPPSFRHEFGDELQIVFAAAVADATAQGRLAFAMTCGRELRDLAPALVREYAAHWFRKDVTMQTLTAKSHGNPVLWGALGLGLAMGLKYVATTWLSWSTRGGVLSPLLTATLTLLLYALTGALAGLSLGWATGKARALAPAGALGFVLALGVSRGTYTALAAWAPTADWIILLAAVFISALCGAVFGAVLGGIGWGRERLGWAALAGGVTFGIGELSGRLLQSWIFVRFGQQTPWSTGLAFTLFGVMSGALAGAALGWALRPRRVAIS
jgi:hypothetical protein